MDPSKMDIDTSVSRKRQRPAEPESEDVQIKRSRMDEADNMVETDRMEEEEDGEEEDEEEEDGEEGQPIPEQTLPRPPKRNRDEDEDGDAIKKPRLAGEEDGEEDGEEEDGEEGQPIPEQTLPRPPKRDREDDVAEDSLKKPRIDESEEGEVGPAVVPTPESTEAPQDESSGSPAPSSATPTEEGSGNAAIPETGEPSGTPDQALAEARKRDAMGDSDDVKDDTRITSMLSETSDGSKVPPSFPSTPAPAPATPSKLTKSVIEQAVNDILDEAELGKKKGNKLVVASAAERIALLKRRAMEQEGLDKGLLKKVNSTVVQIGVWLTHRRAPWKPQPDNKTPVAEGHHQPTQSEMAVKAFRDLREESERQFDNCFWPEEYQSLQATIGEVRTLQDSEPPAVWSSLEQRLIEIRTRINEKLDQYKQQKERETGRRKVVLEERREGLVSRLSEDTIRRKREDFEKYLMAVKQSIDALGFMWPQTYWMEDYQDFLSSVEAYRQLPFPEQVRQWKALREHISSIQQRIRGNHALFQQREEEERQAAILRRQREEEERQAAILLYQQRHELGHRVMEIQNSIDAAHRQWDSRHWPEELQAFRNALDAFHSFSVPEAYARLGELEHEIGAIQMRCEARYEHYAQELARYVEAKRLQEEEQRRAVEAEARAARAWQARRDSEMQAEQRVKAEAAAAQMELARQEDEKRKAAEKSVAPNSLLPAESPAMPADHVPAEPESAATPTSSEETTGPEATPEEVEDQHDDAAISEGMPSTTQTATPDDGKNADDKADVPEADSACEETHEVPGPVINNVPVLHPRLDSSPELHEEDGAGVTNVDALVEKPKRTVQSPPSSPPAAQSPPTLTETPDVLAPTPTRRRQRVVTETVELEDMTFFNYTFGALVGIVWGVGLLAIAQDLNWGWW